METHYDLIGALPNDDADSLRAAFRCAVKRAHPDLNPGDPDAGQKFRRIVRAKEILSDVEQRAAYDQLLEVTRVEEEVAAKQAVAAKIHKVASDVMALAGVSVVAIGSYAVFLQLSANALTPVTTPTTIVAASGEEPSNVSGQLPQTSGHTDGPISRIVAAAESTRSDISDTAYVRVGPQRDRTRKHATKILSAHINHSNIFYGLRKFARSFAELAPAIHRQKARRPAVSSSHRRPLEETKN